MITRKMIQKGFEKGLITIENGCYGCCGLCCKIGDNAFCFLGAEGDELTVKEYWSSYTLEETINMIFDILKDVKSAEEHGLDKGEWEYYEFELIE